MNIDNEKFAQANELIKATHKMNNRELKTIFFACTIRDENEEVITVPYSVICDKLGISRGGKTDKLFSDAWDSMMDKDKVTIPAEWSRTGKKIKGHVISSIRWNDSEVDIVFNRDFLPLLDNLKNDHTWMYLEQLAKLDRAYSPRFYEFFKMILKNNRQRNFRWYLNTRGDKDIGLKEFIGVNELKTYKRFNALREKIIEPSIAEINEKSNDISVGWNVYYKGRNAIAIDLRIYASSSLPIQDPMHPEHQKYFDEDGVIPGQMSIYDAEKENPRSNRRISGRNTKLQNVRVDKLIKFNSDILYNWLDDEERKKRSRTEL